MVHQTIYIGHLQAQAHVFLIYTWLACQLGLAPRNQVDFILLVHAQSRIKKVKSQEIELWSSFRIIFALEY